MATGGVLELTRELIARRSITPEDGGCQALIADRLQRAGFDIEHLRFGAVDNLWATHGKGAPVLVLLGHTDVVPPGPLADTILVRVHDLARHMRNKVEAEAEA